ncbi:MAG: gamma-glutamyltransferase family protein [Thalassobaculales bacterium]
MFTTRPEILGTFGVVASTHWLATAAGMATLENGGNAFDAAVATGLALQVVEPHLNGPGGDLPVLLHDARRGATEAICAQGVAPAAASIAAFRDLGLDLVPGTGLLATCVPGAFDGWMLMLRDYGTMTLSQVFGHCIAYARDGYPLVPRISGTIETVKELFETEWPSSAAVYLPGGKVPAAGSIFRNPAMAAFYERLVREAEAGGGSREAQIDRARDIWYRGWVAETIGRFCRDNAFLDVSGRRNRGMLTADDMAAWQATVEKPLAYDYGRYTVYKCGPWSQGPALLQQLAILKGMGLDGGDPSGPEFVHLVVEAAKLAFADREAYYGDPNFVDVPMQQLLSDAYNDGRRALVGDAASLELRPGAIAGFAAGPIAQGRAETADKFAGAVGEPTVKRSGRTIGDTCHVDVIDRHGNMVSATPSGGWLQSSPVIPEFGFCLGSRMQMFWLDDSSPNALAPGKRPRTTLSPSLAARDGTPWLSFGTPGGDQQDQWQVSMFLHLAHHGMNLQQAIDAPNFHTEHFPSSFWPRAARPGYVRVEGQFPAATVDALRARGHDVEVGEPWSEGRLTAAAKEGELLKAAANPRGMQGYAIGR